MVRVCYSCVVDFPIEAAWKMIGNFGDLSWFNPDVKVTLEKGVSDLLPSRRNQMGDKVTKENLLGVKDEPDHKFLRYSVEKGFEFFNVDNYVGCMNLYRITQSNQTFFVWEVNFDLRQGEEKVQEDIVNFVSSIVKGLSEFKFK